MAKAVAVCKCSKCGNGFNKIGYKKNRTEADSWKEWVEANCTTCTDCYKEEQLESKKSDPFTAELFVEIRDNKVVCGLKITSDNSYARKEELKAYGFKFKNKWELVFVVENLNQMIEKINEEVKKFEKAFVGSKVKSSVSKDYARILFEEVEKISAELNNLAEKPEYPEEFTQLVAGRKWNGKIYGGSQKSIYLDGCKVEISASLAEKVVNTQKVLDKYGLPKGI